MPRNPDWECECPIQLNAAFRRDGDVEWVMPHRLMRKSRVISPAIHTLAAQGQSLWLNNISGGGGGETWARCSI